MKNYKLTAIKELKDLIFIVEKYQRGYKWGIKEVEYLLNDINEFNIKVQSFYCLQPIVLKEINTTSYELIDGQQRLSTIYIITKCLKGNYKFKVDYDTRPQSRKFLSKISKIDVVNINPNNKRKEINDAWSAYITQEPKNDNVDNYHFYSAYQVISNWLNQLGENEKIRFITNLYEHTKIIWYEVINTQTAEEIFINFNQGKIQLEQAELIKALFVLQLKNINNNELKTYRTNQFAEEWNQIETKLQDNKFWFFVSNDSSNKKEANRIDLLFDIICGKEKNEEDVLYSYHKYVEKLNEKVYKTEHWQEIKNLHNLLLEWFDDRETYHLIGLLVYLEIKSISEINNEYINNITNKDSFKERLTNWLRNHFDNDKYDLPNLDYKNAYKETMRKLILFNIATYQISDFNYRFPFDKLKETKQWSLEHIHAQNADEFKTIKEVKEWLKDIIQQINEINKIDNQEDLNNINGLITNLERRIVDIDANDTIKQDVKHEIKTLSDLLKRVLEKDNITNLCLLDGATNSALGNDNFINKRTQILKIDSEGEADGSKVFIPICTKHVFLKYYTKTTKNIQFTYWGIEDRDNYKKAIIKVLNKYLNIQ